MYGSVVGVGATVAIGPERVARTISSGRTRGNANVSKRPTTTTSTDMDARDTYLFPRGAQLSELSNSGFAIH